MNELEKTKNIIESKYYSVIFDAITRYLQENPEAFWFDGDYCYQYWYELGLCDYKIVELYSVMDQGTKIMEIVVAEVLQQLQKNQSLQMGKIEQFMQKTIQLIYVLVGQDHLKVRMLLQVQN